MAIRNIVTKGDDVLRKTCRTQMQFDDKLATILPEIKTVEENLKKARSIKSIGTNYDY